MTQGRLDPALSWRSILPPLGVRLQPASPPHNDAVYLKPLMDYLIRQDCKTGSGYWTLPNGLKVDGRFGCTAFADSPTITHIENHVLPGNARVALNLLQQACREAGASLSILANDGQQFLLQCKGSPPVVPESIYLDRL